MYTHESTNVLHCNYKIQLKSLHLKMNYFLINIVKFVELYYLFCYTRLTRSKDRRLLDTVYQKHIIIVGAGIVGLSTAYALLRTGMQHVTLLEQATVDHHRSTSHGLSRLLRFEYGNDLFYTEMVQLSLERWRQLEQVSRRTLYTETGVLVLGREDDMYTRTSYQTLSERGYPIERLTRQRCLQRFPQFAPHAFDMFTYNANAGMLLASTILQTLKELIIDLGVTLVEGQRVEHIHYDNPHRPICLQTHTGDELSADAVLLATGPWVHTLLGDLHLPVRMTRQHLLYFSHLPVPTFSTPTFPAFIAGDLYGFPVHSSCTGQGPDWLKVASHSFGAPIDPDAPSIVDELTVSQVAQQAYELIPALRSACLAHIDSCMYDVSYDEDFILDHHPDDPRIVFATGLSGHGFKFGPLLGEILSSLLRQAPPPIPIESFRLSRFAPLWRKQSSSVA